MKYFTKFSTFAEKYMKSVSIRLDKTTINGYNSYLKTHILPYFGNRYINKIKTEDSQAFIEYLVDNDLSPKTIKNVFSLYRSIMVRALKWDYIKKNPCEYVDLPPLTNKETDYYNEKEIRKLIRTLDKLDISDLKFKVAVELAFLCGLRKSEICGLDWKNVNLSKHTCRINNKRVIIQGEGVVNGKPKTNKSNRDVVIPEPLLTDLKTLKKISNGAAVIQNEHGDPIYPQVLARWFTRFLKDNGLRHISLHKLRHSYASLLATLDIDIKTASEQLGHSQTTTTLNIYTHMFNDIREDIAKKITKRLYN